MLSAPTSTAPWPVPVTAATSRSVTGGAGGSVPVEFELATHTAASGAGRRGVPNLAHYCASKAAIINLTQTMAIELAPHRIRVNSYVPGHIQTPFWGGIADGFARVWDKSPDQVIDAFRTSVPWGRFGTADDVAAAVFTAAIDDTGLTRFRVGGDTAGATCCPCPRRGPGGERADRQTRHARLGQLC